MSSYRQERLKRKLSNEGQVITLAQEDLKLRRQTFERTEAANREFSENTGRLTSNIEKLTNSVTEVFQRMRQSMAQTPFVAPPPHYTSTSAAWLLLCPLFSSNYTDTTTAP